MTHVLIDAEIVKAIGLSISFVGVILSIITIGSGFLIHRISKKKNKEILKMAGLITAWAVFLFLNSESSSSLDYKTVWLMHSWQHLISLFIGAATIIVFLFMFSRLEKVFDRKLLIIAGIFAVLSILMGLTFPFFGNHYLGLLNRIIMIILPIMGFFMIIKFHIGNRGKGV